LILARAVAPPEPQFILYPAKGLARCSVASMPVRRYIFPPSCP
jgi:hypothetical protein